jgi:hypothetical protein
MEISLLEALKISLKANLKFDEQGASINFKVLEEILKMLDVTLKEGIQISGRNAFLSIEQVLFISEELDKATLPA